MRIFGYWGKAQEGWHLLPYHSLDVAACALSLLRWRHGVSQSLRELTGLNDRELAAWVGWAAALHDLGKLSPGFQQKVSAVATQLGQRAVQCPTDVRHDSLGWVLWRDGVRPQLELTPDQEDRADIWMRCATGHHGVPPSRAPGGRRVVLHRYFPGAEREVAQEWITFANELFAPDWATGNSEQLHHASWWIAGLVTLADWLGSSREWFPYRSDAGDLRDYWALAQRQADVAVRESGLARTSHTRSFAELFPTYVPTPLQREVVALTAERPRPFFLVIEEATGGGKTEAAIAAAGGEGFFFGLPTMATANGLWSRVTHLGGQQSLIHGKRWLLPAAMERAEAWVNDSSRKALLASVGVGTVDQAMLAVLHARFGALRLAALAGQTLIVDEVHAYDPYMTRILERLVEFHARAGGSVILLSATMPLSVRASFTRAWARGRGLEAPFVPSADFPLVTHWDGQTVAQRPSPSFRQRRVRVERITSFDGTIDQIAAAAAEGQCVVWIRNTVREALEAFDALTFRGCTADLFHARFVQGDRLDIEKRVLNAFGKASSPAQRRGRVLVATQVVEQSLDLDFDLMVTDLAPIDLVIQRAGRLHRHERGPRGTPTLVVHSPPWTESPGSAWVSDWSRGTGIVYPDYGRLWLTLRLLADGFELPIDSRRLIEGVYGDAANDDVPEGLRDNAARAEQRRLAMTLGARANVISPNADYSTDGQSAWDDEEAPTRLGERTREWVVCEEGIPIRGDVESSVISLRCAVISHAPSCPRPTVGPWRSTMALTRGEVACERPDGSQITVSYDARRGLRW